MSKFDDALDTYLQSAEKIGLSVEKSLLEKVTRGLGPSIYNADSSKVSSSDQAELDRVKQNFLIKKLGIPDSPALDELISNVVDKLGSSNPNKYRALFYYLLVKATGKEDIYN